MQTHSHNCLNVKGNCYYCLLAQQKHTAFIRQTWTIHLSHSRLRRIFQLNIHGTGGHRWQWLHLTQFSSGHLATPQFITLLHGYLLFLSLAGLFYLVTVENDLHWCCVLVCPGLQDRSSLFAAGRGLNRAPPGPTPMSGSGPMTL